MFSEHSVARGKVTSN